MLQSISWGQLAVGLVIIFTIYYGYLAIRYAADLKSLAPKKKPTVLREQEKFLEEDEPEPEDEAEEIGTATADNPEMNDADFDRIETLVEQLKQRIGEAGKQNLVKGQLNEELQKIIADYPELADSTYRPAINELILYECSENGLTEPTEDELEELWVM